MKGAMSNVSGLVRSHERWARFRFSVIGPLLAAPPYRGRAPGAAQKLSSQKLASSHYRATGSIWSLDYRAVVLYSP
jgi:hypothetical protein